MWQLENPLSQKMNQILLNKMSTNWNRKVLQGSPESSYGEAEGFEPDVG